MKKFYSLLIALLCSATMAFAYDAEIDGIYYNLDAENKIAEVTSCDDRFCYSGNIIIPEKVTYNGVEYSVTSIGGGAFSDCYSLTSITIPNSVTSIGKRAFYYCSSLTSIDVDENNLNYASIDGVLYDKNVTTLIACPGSKTEVSIPNSVTSIGDYAFSHCSSLTSITIPNSVTSIGDEAFEDCSSLTSIDVDENNLNYASIDGVLYDKNVTTLIACPGSKTEVSIPNSVTSIGGYAFSYCSSLTSITIPNSVTSIGDYAFYNCSSLTSITIQAENPPVLEEGYVSSNVFQSVSRSILIKVPCGSKAKYQTAQYWKEFINYEEVPAGTLTVDVNDKTMGFATITKQNNCTDDVAQVQAQALAGYEFVRWSDGATENPHILLVTEDMTITAEFRKIGEEPEDKPGEGETHNNFIVESADKTQGNVKITITAEAIEGFEFDHWSDGSTENPRVVTLDEDVELYAYFRVAGTGLENSVISSASVYGSNGVLYVEGAETDYHVLDAASRLIYSGRDAQLHLPRGVYMVAVGGEVQKVVL